MTDGYLLLGGILLSLAFLLTFLLLHENQEIGPRRIARIGIMLSLALTLGLVESFIPDVLLPGMRLGLANVVVLLVLYVYGAKEGFFVALLKALLVSLLRGSFLNMGGWMALSGSTLSFLGMALLHLLWKRCSIVGVSVFGALLHVSGQILVAYLYIGVGVIGYWPWLLLLSFFTGMATGLLCLVLLRRVGFLRTIRKEKA